MQIDRGFVRIDEGLVHYRHCGEPSDAPPLYMIHASPASSIAVAGLMGHLGATRKVYAPDTLGNGDSAPPALDKPQMDYYAETVTRVLDGLGLDQVDMFGSHTGAHISSEVAIRYPDRVRRLVFDGVAMFTEDERRECLENYAPEMAPDIYGNHLNWAWHFVRDQGAYFPYFKRDPEHVRSVPMPSADVLHAITVEVMKAIRTYHKGYRAAFSHNIRERLPLIEQTTFCMASDSDPLNPGVDETARLVKNSHKAILPGEETPEGVKGKAEAIQRFLDDHD